MQAHVAGDSTNGVSGQVIWTASLPDQDLDFLSHGESLTATYDLVLADNQGGSGTQAVTVVFEGADDAPQITPGAQTGAVTAQPIG